MSRWKETTPAPTTARNDGERVRLEWRIGFITPMFGGGVVLEPENRNKALDRRHEKKPDPITPVRVSSIRGQLRFWWRAAIGSRLCSIEEMRERESELFGTTGKRSRVEISVSGDLRIRPEEVFEARQGNNGRWNPRPLRGKDALAYAAFPLQPAGSLQDRVEPGKLSRIQGTVQLVVRCQAADRDEVERAVETWLALGGLGGRTRRGFGALQGGTWTIEKVLDVGNGPSLSGVPSLAGAKSRSVNVVRGGADDAHRQLLGKLKDFRQGPGVGRNTGREPKRPGRSRWPEPDGIRRLTNMHAPQHVPENNKPWAFPRGAFGMPIIFHFKDRGDPPGNPRDPDPQLVPAGGRDRLASPLVLRPWKQPGADRHFAVAVVLNDPSRNGLRGVICQQNVRIQLNEDEKTWPNSPLANRSHDPLLAFLKFFGN